MEICVWYKYLMKGKVKRIYLVLNVFGILLFSILLLNSCFYV